MKIETALSFIKAKRLSFMALVLSVALPVPAQMARSASYELDYAVVGAASAATSSINQTYEITGLVTMEGLSGGVSATLSNVYTITPLIGDAPDNNSFVKFWSIY